MTREALAVSSLLSKAVTFLSPCSAPGKQFPFLGIKLSLRYLCAEGGADNLGKYTSAVLPICEMGTPAEMTPKFLFRCGRCLRTL